ncbi:hypothetical protein ATANTOWER_017863 [Ataeniobius toweri]|uniref:Uncharacterized protein n=1 Tax=Ataeniobius toweri TaxID=208326 RepID=A0ABU7A7J3_9TELE|nr:hypothetical protein [Ataeniobius toweri]
MQSDWMESIKFLLFSIAFRPSLPSTPFYCSSVCLGSLSSRNNNLCPSLKFFPASSRFSSRIVLDLSPSTIPYLLVEIVSRMMCSVLHADQSTFFHMVAASPSLLVVNCKQDFQWFSFNSHI